MTLTSFQRASEQKRLKERQYPSFQGASMLLYGKFQTTILTRHFRIRGLDTCHHPALLANLVSTRRHKCAGSVWLAAGARLGETENRIETGERKAEPGIVRTTWKSSLIYSTWDYFPFLAFTWQVSHLTVISALDFPSLEFKTGILLILQS